MNLDDFFRPVIESWTTPAEARELARLRAGAPARVPAPGSSSTACSRPPAQTCPAAGWQVGQTKVITRPSFVIGKCEAVALLGAGQLQEGQCSAHGLLGGEGHRAAGLRPGAARRGGRPAGADR